jgi:hypothetical protein
MSLGMGLQDHIDIPHQQKVLVTQAHTMMHMHTCIFERKILKLLCTVMLIWNKH